MTSSATPLNTPRQVLFASLIGTTIEMFDFYIYATAGAPLLSVRKSLGLLLATRD